MPLATVRPDRSCISITSPKWNSPSTPVTPARSSERREPVIARTAPSSRTTEPLVSAAWRTQNRRADIRPDRGANTVPTSGSAASASAARSAAVRRTGTPASAARRAAASFEAIPPVPSAPPGPAVTPSRSPSPHTIVTAVAPPLRGSESYRASTSDRRMRASALIRCATSAARRSLSPNRISLVATVSFSLITGTACIARRRSRVAWALAALSRRPMSAAVRSTCPTTRS